MPKSAFARTKRFLRADFDSMGPGTNPMVPEASQVVSETFQNLREHPRVISELGDANFVARAILAFLQIFAFFAPGAQNRLGDKNGVSELGNDPGMLP